MFSMVKSMHDLTRHQALVTNKKKEAWEAAKLVDPDSFPINKLTADYFDEYVSVWEQDRKLRKRMEGRLGHYLRVQDSLLDHHEAGQGVFVSCKR